jgi:hypothetical protein
MAGVGAVARRRALGASEGTIAVADERDAGPSYLDFPDAASRIKDLNLAVLLGRQVRRILKGFLLTMLTTIIRF